MFFDLLQGIFDVAAFFWRFLVGGGAFGLLFYGLLVTQDYRKRKRFSDATRHMSRDALEAGLAANMWVVAAYVQRRPKGALAARQAEAALVMATVLREHIAAIDNLYPGPRYLKSRRAVLREAKAMHLR